MAAVWQEFRQPGNTRSSEPARCRPAPTSKSFGACEKHPPDLIGLEDHRLDLETQERLLA